MEFLEELNISKETIDKIVSNNDEVELYELSTHCTNVTKLINYFRELGISNSSIEELLINNTYIFLNDFDNIKKSLEEENISEVVSAVNDDSSALEQYI